MPSWFMWVFNKYDFHVNAEKQVFKKIIVVKYGFASLEAGI